MNESLAGDFGAVLQKRSLPKSTRAAVWALALVSAAVSGTAATQSLDTVPLIPRTVLFGNPDRSLGQISPDGRWLAYLAPREGVLNIYVASATEPGKAKPITNDRKRGIRGYLFSYSNNHVLFAQDEGGDENFQVFAVDLTTGEQRALTPRGPRASIVARSLKYPGEVLVSINDRDPKYFDLARVDIATGRLTRVIENTGFSAFTTDEEFVPRYASKTSGDGGTEWYVREGADWKLWSTIPQEDSMTTVIHRLSRDGKTLYTGDSRGRDTAGLYSIDVATGERTLLVEDPRADTGNLLVEPVSGKVQAVSVNYLRSSWVVIDTAIKADLERLQTQLGEGELFVVSRTLDDKHWVVAHSRSDASGKFYLYDRAGAELTLWFDTRAALTGLPLVPMHPQELKSRDGLTLVSYLVLPPGSDPDGDGRPGAPVPMVLLVHGGPWGRDFYGMSAQHQWLANRGYAVLSVNFRGSTGFGKSFTNAGDREWGRAMHQDLIDAVDWAIKSGIAQREKIAIMGVSYGGYAALAGVTFTPTTFACAVDIVGPANLVTLLNTIPPYWESQKRIFAARVGDLETEEGLALLKQRSPLTHVDRIQRPLLIGQGANDPRVKQAESDQIVTAMKEKKIPVTYVLYPDEGHGFARPPNRISFNAVAEGFLSTYLGGRNEPVGDDFRGATLQVPVGSELIKGLPEALKALPAVPSK